MFGKSVHQEEEALLREIIRSINKKLDYSAREGAGSRFSLHVSYRGYHADIALDLEDLKAAKTDMVRRHRLDESRYGDDVLGLKPAKLLPASPKPEQTQQGGFGLLPRR